MVNDKSQELIREGSDKRVAGYCSSSTSGRPQAYRHRILPMSRKLNILYKLLSSLVFTTPMYPAQTAVLLFKLIFKNSMNAVSFFVFFVLFIRHLTERQATYLTERKKS